MPYVEMTAADLPHHKVCRVVLNPDTHDPDLVPDRIVYATQEGDYVYCAQPAFLDALIRLFQSLEKGGEDDAARPSCVRGNHS